jgi:hypothetical protein
MCTNGTDSREAYIDITKCNPGFYFVKGPVSDTCAGL